MFSVLKPDNKDLLAWCLTFSNATYVSFHCTQTTVQIRVNILAVAHLLMRLFKVP